MNQVIYEAYKNLEQFAECKGEYISKEERNELLQILKKKEYYNEELLRVVLVGRTNAGKSTLTNAFVGKKIAHVKRRESTSWNTCFWPSEVEYCIATDNNYEMDNMSVERFVDIMNSVEERNEYLKNKTSIDVFFKTEDVHFAILDVPGFATQNKENEITAFEELRQADVVLFLIPANNSISGSDMALYHEILSMNKPIEIVITKSEYRSQEELGEFKLEIQTLFQTNQEIYSISAKECIKGNEQALVDRKCLIQRINEHQVIGKELRRRNNAQFELSTIDALRKLQQKVLRDVDKRFSDKYREQVELYKKEEDIVQRLSEKLYSSAQKSYCKPYYDELIEKMTSISIKECISQIDIILKETIPEKYLLDYWKQQVENMEQILETMWESEIGNTECLYQYTSLIKKGRIEYKNQALLSEKEEQLKGGIGVSAGLSTAVSFYLSVLGPAAEYITFLGAMTSVGIPLAGVGIAISAFLSTMNGKEQSKLSKEDAKKILKSELAKESNVIIQNLIKESRSLNAQHVEKEIKAQEEALRKSLPEGLQRVELSINALEKLGTLLLNRELELKELINFYITHPIETTEMHYIDPVEQEIDNFINLLNQLETPVHINTLSRVVFMPILFLSKENKAHVFCILNEMCAKTETFKKKVEKSKFETSYYFEDEICAIYFSHKINSNKIDLEYIDVFERDEDYVKQFSGKVREGSILSDCQMRRKILSDISRATKRVEILVPWMNGAMEDGFDYYKNYSFMPSMSKAIEQALKNGAVVVIGCGNSEDSDKEKEILSRKTKEILEEKFKSYCMSGKLVFYMRSFTHEKFLIVDDRIAMCGSYNYLSNRGKFIDRVKESVSRGKQYGVSSYFKEAEFPGESMKLTENIESIQLIRKRMQQKYN